MTLTAEQMIPECRRLPRPVSLYRSRPSYKGSGKLLLIRAWISKHVNNQTHVKRAPHSTCPIWWSGVFIWILSVPGPVSHPRSPRTKGKAVQSALSIRVHVDDRLFLGCDKVNSLRWWVKKLLGVFKWSPLHYPSSSLSPVPAFPLTEGRQIDGSLQLTLT